MSDKREGPSVRIEASCFDCKYEHGEHYAVQGDSGCDVSCTHPDSPKPACVGDTTWKTPTWCPLLPDAIRKLFEREI